MGGVHISRVGELLRCSELHRGWGAGKPRLRAEYKHAVKSRWKTGGLQNGRGPYKRPSGREFRAWAIAASGPLSTVGWNL